jgi:hypothetical protein
MFRSDFARSQHKAPWASVWPSLCKSSRTADRFFRCLAHLQTGSSKNWGTGLRPMACQPLSHKEDRFIPSVRRVLVETVKVTTEIVGSPI